MRIKITKPAKMVLDEIYIFYKEAGNGLKGKRIRAAVLKKALLLKTFPEMGQEEERLKKKNQRHRYLVMDNYKIIYRIEEDIIYITDVFDTRQDPDKM